VKELKRDILNTFISKLPGISYEGLAKGIADAYKVWIPGLGFKASCIFY
jgi:hypothetical protein